MRLKANTPPRFERVIHNRGPRKVRRRTMRNARRAFALALLGIAAIAVALLFVIG